MSVRALLSTLMKPKFFSVYSYMSYLPAEVRAGRKEDELLETKINKNQKTTDDERPGYYK